MRRVRKREIHRADPRLPAPGAALVPFTVAVFGAARPGRASMRWLGAACARGLACRPGTGCCWLHRAARRACASCSRLPPSLSPRGCAAWPGQPARTPLATQRDAHFRRRAHPLPHFRRLAGGQLKASHAWPWWRCDPSAWALLVVLGLAAAARGTAARRSAAERVPHVGARLASPGPRGRARTGSSPRPGRCGCRNRSGAPSKR